MTLEPTDEMMRQSMHRLLDKVGEEGEYSVEDGYVRIFGVKDEELEHCYTLMEEPTIRIEDELDEDGQAYTVTAYYTEMRGEN